MPDDKPYTKVTLAAKSWFEEMLVSIDDWFKPLVDMPRNWQKMRDVMTNNFDLGMYHLQAGNLGDAIFRFKIVTWLDPNQVTGWYYLGCAYMAEGKVGPAQRAFRKALQINPDYEEALYMMAVALGSATPVAELPKKIPLSLSESHFNSIAANFTENQLDILQYQGHVMLAQALHAAIFQGRIDHMILELGVGTGLCGPLMRDVASQIIGVDISNAMLSEAMQLRDEGDRKIYDALLNREMLDFLNQSPAETYDIVMAGGVLSYVGDLQGLFEQVTRVLKPGGVFGFTADEMPETLEGDGFRFAPTAGRFRFARSYLEQLAVANGLQAVVFEEGAVYPEYLSWICVFAK